MNTRLRFSSSHLVSLIALLALGCDAPGSDEVAATASSEVVASCGASSLLAGAGLRAALAASVDPRFVAANGDVAIPGALQASTPGFQVGSLEPVLVTDDAGVSVSRNDQGEPCGFNCGSITAYLGAEGSPHGPKSEAAQDAAERLFAAIVRARETVSSDGARTRTTEHGFVRCTAHATTPPTHVCAIGGVASVSPSSVPEFNRPICGLVACATTQIRTRMGVVEDLAAALEPASAKGGLEIPEVLTGWVGMGTEALTTVAGVRIGDADLLTRPRSPVSASFGGRLVGGGEGSAGYRAGRILFEAMVRVPETQNPMTLAFQRASADGRVLCTKQANNGDGGVYYGCQLTDVHQFGPAESGGALTTVCAAP